MQDHLWSFQGGSLGAHPQETAAPGRLPDSKGWTLPPAGHDHPVKVHRHRELEN